MDESSPPRVIVADDNLLFAARLSASLSRLGYLAVPVRTAEALHSALRLAPRAAILNLAARAFDAAGAIRRAKQDDATRTIPLLGFCGHRDAARSAAALAAGCDRVTTNGMVASNFEQALRELLEVPEVPGTSSR